MALGDVVRDEGVEFEVVFDGERWADGRVGLLGKSPLRRGSSLSFESMDRARSERREQQRQQRKAQEEFEAMFR